MISVKGLVKKFGDLEVLKGIDAEINKGDVICVIGPSGSGKSTFLRCLNLLEKPDGGHIIFEGDDLTSKKIDLNAHRQKIGMVFQQFNLLEGKTVKYNVSVPLLLAGAPRGEIDRRVREVLSFVELEDKENAYVSQLSGGQKQRVGIARALATKPQILLCDEATSALDPQTTGSILRLLERVNRRMGVTILLITHQMQVIQMICNKVAVMEHGKIVEEGEVYSLFSNPSQPITRRFVDLAGNIGRAEELLEEDEGRIRLENGDWLLRLKFLEGSAARAIVGISRPVP